MSKSKELEQIIIDILQGESTDDFTVRLIETAHRFEQNPVQLFSEINLVENNFEELHHILNVVEPTQKNDLILKYFNWCKTLNLSTNLFNFLEFLTSEGYHRLHPYIQIIKNINIHKSAMTKYICGSLVFISAAGLVTLLVNPKLLQEIEDWFNHHYHYLMHLTFKYILIAENLAFILLLFKTIKFIFQFYALINNHATNEENKFNKLIKLFINNALIISAQALYFTNNGIMSPFSGYLIIAASFFELAWSIYSLSKLKKPIEPQFLESDDLNIRCARRAHFLEEQAFYKRKLKIFYHEVWAFALIAVATTLTIIFAQQFLVLNILCIVIQLVISLLKDYLIFRSEKNLNTKLQDDIKKIYAPTLFPTQRYINDNSHMAIPSSTIVLT